MSADRKVTTQDGDWLQIGGGSTNGFGTGKVEVRVSRGGNAWSWQTLTEAEKAEIVSIVNAHRRASPATDGSPTEEELEELIAGAYLTHFSLSPKERRETSVNKLAARAVLASLPRKSEGWDEAIEAAAKIAEEPIEEYIAQHTSWRNAFGEGAGQPYDGEISTRKEIAAAIRALKKNGVDHSELKKA